MLKLPETHKDTFLVIDASFIPFIACNPNKAKDENGEPIKDENGKYIYDQSKTLDDIKYHIDNIFISIFTALDTKYYLAFVDNNFKKNFRLNYYPDYKGNRKDREQPPFLNEAKQYLVDYWHTLPVEGLEADDVCVICKNHYQNAILVSPDKDLYNLNGNCYNPTTNQFITNNLINERIFFVRQMIEGDSADNIKGIKGKGKKFAQEFINQFSPEDFLSNIVLDKVFSLYKDNYGEYNGINEFYKNYHSLHILQNLEEVPDYIELEIPSPYLANV